MNPVNTKVCVVGIWHLGAVTSACLAELGYSVVGVETNPQKAQKLNEGVAPLYEPGLSELMRKNLGQGRLLYTSDLPGAVKQAQFVLLAFDTPVNDDDEVELYEVLKGALDIRPWLAEDATVIVTSQVPVGTCEHIESAICDFDSRRKVRVGCVPENLRLGKAIDCFLKPAMIVLGADDDATLDRLQQFYSALPAPKLLMNLRTAEMTKHALNAFLATSVSFIGELANLCDEVGADAVQVAAALRHDERIGPHARIEPGGLGFSGATLARDVKVLRHLGEACGCEPLLLDAVWYVNERQKGLVARKLKKLFGDVRGRRLGVLGLTYKAGTSTLRRSVALEVIRELVELGAAVKAFDPKANLAEVPQQAGFELSPDAYSAAKDSDALILLTDWPEFRALDFARIRSLMRRPVLIDTKNTLSSRELVALGFDYVGVGRGQLARRVPIPATRPLARTAVAAAQKGSTSKETLR